MRRYESHNRTNHLVFLATSIGLTLGGLVCAALLYLWATLSGDEAGDEATVALVAAGIGAFYSIPAYQTWASRFWMVMTEQDLQIHGLNHSNRLWTCQWAEIESWSWNPGADESDPFLLLRIASGEVWHVDEHVEVLRAELARKVPEREIAAAGATSR
jgi:hypothetical protein